MATFPIEAEKGEKVGDGWRVETHVKLSNNGSLDGETTLINKNAVEGFHGGAVILLTDAAGNVVFNAGLYRTGVNAAGFSPKRTATLGIHADIPADRVQQTEHIEIINGHFPGDVGQQLKDAIQTGKSLADAIAKIWAVAG
jgi:hypothetical protein